MINYFKNTTLFNKNLKNKIVPVSQTNNLMGNENVISDLNSFDSGSSHNKGASSFENAFNSAEISAEHVNNLASSFSDIATLSGLSDISQSSVFDDEKSNILDSSSHDSEMNSLQKYSQNTVLNNTSSSVDYDQLYQFILNEIKKEMRN